MAMTGFICHDNYYDRIKRLSNEEVGSLFRALMLYHAGREDEIPPFIDGEGIAFDFIKDDIDYMESKNEINRLNGLKGGRPKKEPTETENNPDKPNKTEEKPTKGYKDKDKDKYKDKDKESNKRFTPPTLEEVTEYCKERNNGINPQHFIDYYETRGWELKPGQKVKNWRACIRTWEGRNLTNTSKRVIAQDFSQRDYSDVPDRMLADLDREMADFQVNGA